MSRNNPLKDIRENAKLEQSSNQVFQADSKYLKHISGSDHARPTLLPLVFVALAILVISCIDCIFYFNKISEWTLSAWEYVCWVIENYLINKLSTF